MSTGSTISRLLSANPHSSSKQKDNNIIHKSPTTNSYDKCIRSLSGKFPASIIEEAIKMVDRHDQNDFIERKIIGIVYEEDIAGNKILASNKILHVRGTYKWVLFAHLKTIEMWYTYDEVNLITK
jgi:hypothetical protein